jgi:UDP-N-acetylglucosamine acyltransferase
MLGGGCGISKDVPPFCLVKPLEGNTIAGLNSVGLRRSTITTKDRQEIKEAFKLLFQSGLNISDAVEKIKSAYPSGPAAEISTFVDESKQGICKM